MYMLQTRRAISLSAAVLVLAATAPANAGATARRQAVTIGGAQLAGQGKIVHRGTGVPRLPKVSASSYLIADADTGQVLAAKDPHGRYRPASTMKILTAITLLPRLDGDTKIKPSRKACDVEGSKVGLVTEMRYSVDDLFRGLLMVSGNDAAIALAQQTSGGLSAALDEMNTEARRLQGYDTVAKSPNGLDRKGQHTSAYDLALFARSGLNNPRFRDYISTVSYKFPAPRTKKQKKKHTSGGYMIHNHNRLLTRYHGALGVKNGYTSKAKATFVGAAKRNGHTLLITLMHSDPSFWDDASDLLDWGFTARGTAQPIGRLVAPNASARPSPRPTSAQPTPAHSTGRRADAPTTDPGSGSGGGKGPLIGIAVAIVLLFGGIGYAFARRRRRWF